MATGTIQRGSEGLAGQAPPKNQKADRSASRPDRGSQPAGDPAYETKVLQLERKQRLVEEEPLSVGKPRHTLEESFELAPRKPVRSLY